MSPVVSGDSFSDVFCSDALAPDFLGFLGVFLAGRGADAIGGT